MTQFFRSSAWVHRLLIISGLLVPALFFAGAAWKSRTDVLHDGETTTLNAVAVLGDSLRDLLQTEELVLAEVAELFHGRDQKAVASPETSALLVKLKAPLDQIGAIWITDRDGTILAASQPWEPGRRIPEREFFQIDQTNQSYLSAVYTGQSAQPTSIAVIRRRLAPDGRFDGTIRVELSPAYLAHLFAQATQAAHDVLLVGPGGQMITGSDPHATLQQREAIASLMRRVALQPHGGVFSGPPILGGHTKDLYSYEQLPGYPVWISLAVDRAAILRRWYDSLQAYGIAAATGAFALLTASWIAIRRARAEQAAFALLHQETERRLKAEQRMREAQRLEAVGQLAGGIAHDFNNLLTVIMGSLDLIGTIVGPTERVQRLIAQARRASERGARLTWSLLTFARRQVLQTDKMDINQFISEFLPAIQQSIGDTISVELRLAPNLPPCRADPVQLEAALLNVAINARDAMGEGGTLTITTRETELTRNDLAHNNEAEPGAFVAVSMTDTGIGMPQEVAAKAFEPFFTTKEVGKGGGLGLSQVLGFVRQLGGHVTIESAPGRGSAVTLFLPRA